MHDKNWYVHSSLFLYFLCSNNIYRESKAQNSLPSYLVHRKGARRPDGLNSRLSICNKHHRVFVEPTAGGRGSFHSALSITLSTRLDPDDAIDVRVTSVGGGTHTESDYLKG